MLYKIVDALGRELCQIEAASAHDAITDMPGEDDPGQGLVAIPLRYCAGIEIDGRQDCIYLSATRDESLALARDAARSIGGAAIVREQHDDGSHSEWVRV